MRKVLALALIVLAIAGGVAVYSLEKPAPAAACQSAGCSTCPLRSYLRCAS
jgi:hypothetical protein